MTAAVAMPGGHGAVMATDTGADMSTDMTADIQADTARPNGRTSARTPKGQDTATRVAKLVAKTPDMDVATIAAKLSISDRTARRHLTAIKTVTNPDGAGPQPPKSINGTHLASVN
jgi:hypothetical protein